VSSWFRAWVARNIQSSIAILEANANRFPKDYMAPYAGASENLVKSVPHCKVLHMGCGAGHRAALAARQPDSVFVGVDLDYKSLCRYPSQHKVVANLEQLPFRPGTFDVALSEEVFEHIEHPKPVVAELSRALRPGGKVAFATPCKLGYISLVAWLTPFWFHRWIQDLLNPDSPKGDHLHPTFYRLNTPWTIRRYMRRFGFRELHLEITEVSPWMLRIHPWLVRLGILWSALVQRYQLLAPLRNRILGVYERV
jgi:SAM-dependent methyltransferase